MRRQVTMPTPTPDAVGGVVVVERGHRRRDLVDRRRAASGPMAPHLRTEDDHLASGALQPLDEASRLLEGELLPGESLVAEEAEQQGERIRVGLHRPRRPPDGGAIREDSSASGMGRRASPMTVHDSPADTVVSRCARITWRTLSVEDTAGGDCPQRSLAPLLDTSETSSESLKERSRPAGSCGRSMATERR